jgi:hypothetical protein
MTKLKFPEGKDCATLEAVAKTSTASGGDRKDIKTAGIRAFWKIRDKEVKWWQASLGNPVDLDHGPMESVVGAGQLRDLNIPAEREELQKLSYDDYKPSFQSEYIDMLMFSREDFDRVIYKAMRAELSSSSKQKGEEALTALARRTYQAMSGEGHQPTAKAVFLALQKYDDEEVVLKTIHGEDASSTQVIYDNWGVRKACSLKNFQDRMTRIKKDIAKNAR